MIVLCLYNFLFFFFKQKTAYEMRISDWSSDVCSSDLLGDLSPRLHPRQIAREDIDLQIGRSPRRRLIQRRHFLRMRDDVEREMRLAVRLVGDFVDRQRDAIDGDRALGRDMRREMGRESGRERVCQYV